VEPGHFGKGLLIVYGRLIQEIWPLLRIVQQRPRRVITVEGMDHHFADLRWIRRRLYGIDVETECIMDSFLFDE
jgi:hypothetical protein